MTTKAVFSAAIPLLAGTFAALADSVPMDAKITPVAVSPSVIFGDANPLLVRIQAKAEKDAWQALDENASPAQLMIFLENYPGGTYETEAKRRLLTALESELATQPAETAEPAELPQANGERGLNADADATVSQASLSDKAVPADDGVVRFSVPLFHGDSHVAGKSLQQLIAGSPMFPPVEGLPEAYWKEQTCSNCHEWTQANLCEQASFYMRDDGAANLAKQHPYGGTFKQNLRVWAQGDCQ